MVVVVRGIPGCLGRADKLLSRPELLLKPQVTLHTHPELACVCLSVWILARKVLLPLACRPLEKFMCKLCSGSRD